MASGTYARTFTAAGTINYHCQVHSRMHGTVIVGG
jgi:plastocyanin